jgi:hypothetical protein
MISKFAKTCSKTVPGNNYKLFVANVDDISSATFSNNVLTAISMDGSTLFAELQADFDSVTFTSDGTATIGFYSEQSLIARFAQKTTEMEDFIDDLRDAAVCGLVAIRLDGNDRYWISGIAPLNKMGANRPYLTVETNFTSGEGISDIEAGNKYTITLGRLSATEEYMIDPSLGEVISDGTATWIDFV